MTTRTTTKFLAQYEYLTGQVGSLRMVWQDAKLRDTLEEARRDRNIEASKSLTNPKWRGETRVIRRVVTTVETVIGDDA